MQEQVIVHGQVLTAQNLPTWRQGKTGMAAELADFLDEWFSASPTMWLHTSGSTGKPKPMQATKAAMRASALATCRFFQLGPGCTALLCLPLRYIAGKMMVVRAIVGGFNLILQEPSSTPLQELSTPVDFVPLVPMQVQSTLQQKNGAEALQRARQILLGGGFIEPHTEAALQSCPGAVYASYGMTETLSHIALRRVNGPEATAYYTPLPGVRLSLSPRGTLALSVPYLGIDYLETNDLAEIAADGKFRIVGRADCVINSGGVKIQAEELEQQLRAATGLNLIIVPLPHPVLGQTVGLLWEGEPEEEPRLHQAIAPLPRYHRPACIVRGNIPLTATGKPARAAAIAFLIDKSL
ncbi:MAG: AMP-binding protein, partial [Akkermansia sp.]|nr:AMP-binding protein [Akkermansia sp.]